MKIRAYIGLCLLLATLTAAAGERRYWASLSQSQWSTISGSLKCELRHEIPIYGRVVISRRAGEDLMLTLESDLELIEKSHSNFGADPPSWKHGGRYVQLGRANVAAGVKPVVLERADTLRVMAALDEGDLPGFSYRDPLGSNNQVEILLNVAHYRAAADEFRKCLGQLVDLSFEEVRMTPLFFQFDRDHLTRTTRQRLDQIGLYITSDDSVVQVNLSAHADSRGSVAYNRALSNRRAQAVADYLQRRGVDPKLIEIKALGESNPNLSNRTSQGRSANRRVIVELIRSQARQQARAR